MKTSLLLQVFLISLVGTAIFVELAAAQPDFNAFSGNTITDSQIDGTIGSEWNDAGKYANVSINPTGTAEVWIKHDEAYLYVAVRFKADSSNPWTAMQLAGSICMNPGADGALFGHDEYAPNGYQDAFFGGLGVITMDAVQNGKGAITVDSSNTATIELKKPLNSGDAAGRDIAWSTGNTYELVIMWDSDGGGSSGGETGHHGMIAVTNSRKVFLNPDAIPELSSSVIAGFLVASVVCLVFLRKRLRISAYQTHGSR